MTSPAGGKTLSIVIPAYNEEDAIADILERCLKSREEICRETGLKSVEVIAVDDGSRDRTREIAGRYPEARLVVHDVNRGYGRALMTGFESAAGDYLAFLDADGTCDPRAFVGLYRALRDGDADMAVGNRIHADSHMPRLREAGNRFYAGLISKLTGVPVKDSASGMRVFARELLPRLAPLPSGLHFTPAMTARAACLGARLVEAPIPYAERVGSSKLRIVSDGLRFLRAILGIIFSYRPLMVFGPPGAFFLALAAGYGLGPTGYYLRHGRLEPEDMIYRLLTVLTLSACGLICLAFGGLAQKLSDVANRRPSGVLDRPFLSSGAVAAGALLGLGGVALNARTIWEYATTRQIHVPWVYVLAGGLAVILGTVLAAFGVTIALAAHLPGVSEGKR